MSLRPFHVFIALRGHPWNLYEFGKIRVLYISRHFPEQFIITIFTFERLFDIRDWLEMEAFRVYRMFSSSSEIQSRNIYLISFIREELI